LEDQYVNLENLRKEFVNRFNRKKLETLTKEEYALMKGETNSKDSFCKWIERKLEKLGSIRGGSSDKFGVYFGTKKPDLEKKWHWSGWTNNSFDTTVRL